MKVPATEMRISVEQFDLSQWAMLFVVEEHLVAKKGPFESKNSPPYQDLLINGFVQEIDVPPHIALTDRGWEVAGKLRRWCADKRPIAEFIVSRCGECSRLRYGEKGPCHCGSTK